MACNLKGWVSEFEDTEDMERFSSVIYSIHLTKNVYNLLVGQDSSPCSAKSSNLTIYEYSKFNTEEYTYFSSIYNLQML